MNSGNNIDLLRITRSKTGSLKSSKPIESKSKKVIEKVTHESGSTNVNKNIRTKRSLNISREERPVNDMEPANVEGRAEIEAEWQRIRCERQLIEQQRAELERLRTEMTSSNACAETLQRRRATTGSENNHQPNEQLVNGLVNQLRNLQININVPKFCEESNPMEYIESIERYLKLKNVCEEQCLMVVENIIEGRVRIWYEVVKNQVSTFIEFKHAFLNEFYSIPVRVRFKNQWAYRKYKSSDGSMHSYFYKQLKETRYFDPPLTPYEINYSIIQQLPSRIRSNLSTVNFSDSNSVAQALAQIDLAQEDFERQRDSRYQYNRGRGNQVNSLRFSQNARSDYRGYNNYYGRKNSKNERYDDRNYRYPNNNRGYKVWENRQEKRIESRDSPTNVELPDVRFPPPRAVNCEGQSVRERENHLN